MMTEARTRQPGGQAALALNDINLADPDFWSRADVYPALAALRRESPVTWHTHPESGPGFWSVVRHRDIEAVSRDVTTFASRYGTRAHHATDGSTVRPGAGT